MCKIEKCMVCGRKCEVKVCECKEKAARWVDSGECFKWLSSEEYLRIHASAVEAIRKEYGDRPIFNISILAAFKLMGTAPDSQKLRLQTIQEAEFMLSLSLSNLDPNEALYNTQKNYAYRCTLLGERRAQREQEKPWDNRPIKERIESGWYGGQW
ncbi:hypothetical protein VE03_10678 [Pseudogymnoascus sp. 23342-1-I1]|nr:hypothetical protein VE03_10678 [Pseudogymnoascus sp. 23342-1-I1]